MGPVFKVGKILGMFVSGNSGLLVKVVEVEKFSLHCVPVLILSVAPVVVVVVIVVVGANRNLFHEWSLKIVFCVVSCNDYDESKLLHILWYKWVESAMY